MSLAIHFIVKEGIVACSDTRTTCEKQNCDTRYDDNAIKTVAFPNRIVVSHCGDNMISSTMSVYEFLLNLREQYGNQSSITSLPLKLLNEYLAICNDHPGDIEFLISGYEGNSVLSGCSYKIKTKNREIRLEIEPLQYGFTTIGANYIATTIMARSAYGDMTLSGAIELTQACMDMNITAYKYKQAQIIGGHKQTYIINRLTDECGWLIENEIKADTNAPKDGYLQYCQQQAQMLKRKMAVSKRKEQSKDKEKTK